MKIFFFFWLLVFFSELGFLIMSYRGKGETNGGLIAEFEETTGMKGMSKLTRHSTRISPMEFNSRSLCIKF